MTHSSRERRDISSVWHIRQKGKDESNCGQREEAACRTFQGLWKEVGNFTFRTGSTEVITDTDLEIDFDLEILQNKTEKFHLHITFIGNKSLEVNIHHCTTRGIYFSLNGQQISLSATDTHLDESGLNMEAEHHSYSQVKIERCNFTGTVHNAALDVQNVTQVSILDTTFSNLQPLPQEIAFAIKVESATY